MKLTLRLIGIALVCFSLAFTLTACEDDNGADNGENQNGDACADDDECGDDVCVNSQCVETCEDDGDCDGQACLERPDTGDEMICQALDEDFCDEDSDCDEDFERCEDNPTDPEGDDVCVEMPIGQSCTSQDECPRADEFCNTEAEECVQGDLPSYTTVLIQDETEGFGTHPDGNDRCEDSTFGYDTAGAKIMYVELTDSSTGDIIAYGSFVDFEIAGDTFFGEVHEILNGNAPAYDGQCPDVEEFEGQNTNFTDSNVVALGCGGWVTVQFFDNGSPIELNNNHTIWVGEYGPSCDDTDTFQRGNDFYDVYICGDSSQSSTDLDTCDIRLSGEEPGTEILPFEVSIF